MMQMAQRILQDELLNNLFTEWYAHIIEEICPTEQRTVLLILGGHYSHVRNSYVIELSKENHVKMTALPSHSTCKLQPLGRTFVGPLKTHYRD